MNMKITGLSLACALALAACGDKSAPPSSAPDAPATTPAPVTEPAAPAAEMPAPVATPAPDASTAPAADAGTAPADGKAEAVVSNCSTTIEGNDAMQFNVGSITVPSSCSEFTINLKHVGKLPVAAMGHNVVIAAASDRAGISAEGVSAGADGGYLKTGDARVIGHSDLIGGGQTTSVTFAVSKIQGAGPYEFFCSFPGHWAVMHGPIKVG
ncbi:MULTISPECIES: azurin [unclassified Luteimonas]